MTTDELKDLIIWMRANKVKKFKNAEIEFELSDLAFIDELVQDTSKVKEMPLGGGSDLLSTLKPNQTEEDQDLYWSCSR